MSNLFYIITTVLFLIGFWIILSHASLVRKVLGIGVMQGSVYLYILGLGYARGQTFPAFFGLARLVLTGVIVMLFVIAVALALVKELGRSYRTVDVHEIGRLRRMEQ